MRARDIITGNSTCVTTDDSIAITDDEVGRIVERISEPSRELRL